MKYNAYVKKTVLLMIVLGLLYVGITSVLGVQGATSISVGPSSRASFNDTSNANVEVQAGNVTELNISGSDITDHWAGFYGEVSGNLTLANSNDDVFYEWAGINIVAGEVFASNDSAVNWSGIGCASSAEISALNTALGISGSDVDSVNTTYDNNNHPSFNVGAVSGISGCNSTNAYADTGQEADAFYQILLTDTDGDPVYTTLINDTEAGFDAANHDFELLVGQTDLSGTTTMYFYIELD